MTGRRAVSRPGVQMLRKRQSSSVGSVALVCGEAAPKRVASATWLHAGAGTARAKRRGAMP